jgi:hypothetical protein
LFKLTDSSSTSAVLPFSAGNSIPPNPPTYRLLYSRCDQDDLKRFVLRIRALCSRSHDVSPGQPIVADAAADPGCSPPNPIGLRRAFFDHQSKPGGDPMSKRLNKCVSAITMPFTRRMADSIGANPASDATALTRPPHSIRTPFQLCKCWTKRNERGLILGQEPFSRCRVSSGWEEEKILPGLRLRSARSAE